MILNDEEKRILDGEKGPIAQRCMQFLVEYGETAGAEKLIDLDGTVDMHPVGGWVKAYDVTKEEVEEIRKAADYLEGKHCKVRLWIMTNPGTFKTAEMAGYVNRIAQAGGQLLSGACAGLLRGYVMPPFKRPQVVAMDACKQDYYITGHCHPEKVQVRYGTMEDCLDAAVTGRWQGEWR